MSEAQKRSGVLLHVESDGLACLIIDTPGKLNVLSSDVMLALNEKLAEIEQAGSRIKALVLRSGKKKYALLKFSA